ncbi:MAG: hypothetical protein LBD06_07430 [Candidatus Accumulibacter sp.]|nr:hypothetical protein [Accumulibacter sp.]
MRESSQRKIPERRQKTEKTPALGFASFLRRFVPQTDLSSVSETVL